MKYDDVMKLALERGFYFPSCEVYADAQAGFWEYGPAGVSFITSSYFIIASHLGEIN